jgi:hypothetical protein
MLDLDNGYSIRLAVDVLEVTLRVQYQRRVFRFKCNSKYSFVKSKDSYNNQR